MKNLFEYQLTILMLIISLSFCKAQVGEFNVIQDGNVRQVSFYEPESLSDNEPMGMILALHGFGMDGDWMAEELIETAEQESLLVFSLDGNGDRHDDDYGGNEIYFIESVLDSAMAQYQIDTCNVFLMGFSYGGRETMYYGLTFPDRFTGLIGFSPAIQSEADVQNNLPIPWPNPFDYNNASEIPICIYYGADDAGWISDIQSFVSKLEESEGIVSAHAIPGVGHTFLYEDFNEDMHDCIEFIRSNSPSNCNLSMGIESNKNMHGFKITSEVIHHDTYDKFDARVYDINGNLIYNDLGCEILFLSMFQSGFYIAELVDFNGKRTVLKLVK